MPLPDDVPTFTLTFGPYWRADGTAGHVGKWGSVRPSRQLTHVASGDPVLADPIRFQVGPDGTASVGPLPHTDTDALSPHGFTYLVTFAGRVRRIVWPEASGPVADFDELTVSPDTPGVLVPAPDLSGYVTDGELAAALAGVGSGGGPVDLSGYVTDDALADALEALTPGLITGPERSKLAGIAAGATVNDTDANLRDRITHTGHQSVNTITGLATVATSGTYTDLAGRPALAAVATSGAYTDLSGRPTIPTVVPITVTDYGPGSYSYTPPAGATVLDLYGIAPAGGAGGGSKYDAVTAHGGGAAGGGGGYTSRLGVTVADLGGQPLTVTVGAAGVGGAGSSTNSFGGGAGTTGGDLTVTTAAGLVLVRATGGSGGQGGRTSAATAGTGGNGLYGGQSGGTTSTTTANTPAAQALTSSGGGGGGGGGYLTAAGAANPGAAGGLPMPYDARPQATAAVADLAAGGAVVKGTDGAAGLPSWPGLGGRGGNASSTGNGGTGGAGGWPGGAGGGGGAALNGVGNGGAGGSGADGVVRIVAR